jgi:hypothetical protein
MSPELIEGLPAFKTYYYKQDLKNYLSMPCGKKRKRHKIATHKRKKRLRKNRHKKRNK